MSLTFADRSECFETACRLIRECGASPYSNWDFTLRLAQWIAGEAK